VRALGFFNHESRIERGGGKDLRERRIFFGERGDGVCRRMSVHQGNGSSWPQPEESFSGS
jgi:hypothetical protein